MTVSSNWIANSDTEQLFLEQAKRLDFTRHNEMVRELYRRLDAGETTRNPVVLTFNMRVVLADSRFNPEGYTFEDVYRDPWIHAEMQLRTMAHQRFNLKFDWEMGLPEKWPITPYPANVYEQAYWGVEPFFPGGTEVPATRPLYYDEDEGFNQFMAYEFEPMPAKGHMKKMRDYYDLWRERAEQGWEFLGRPVEAVPCVCWSDGPFTAAADIFSPDVICVKMLAEPEEYHAIMDRITQCTIDRIIATRKYYGHDLKTEFSFFADDSIALLSVANYKEFVLPYHQRLAEGISLGQKKNFVHLCGDASRFFPTLIDELNVGEIDTGFPIDFDHLRESIGNEVKIQGGPRVDYFMGPTSPLVEETRRIAQSSLALDGPFVLHEANNLPPLVPEENLKAFYETALASDPRTGDMVS